MFNTKFDEAVNVVSAFVPVNLATAGAVGDVVSMKNFDKCSIIILNAAGGVGEDPIVTVEQATDVTGAGAKAVNFTRYAIKNGAALTSVGTYTVTTMAAGNTVTLSGADQVVLVIDIEGDMLDVDNGFDCIRVSVSDPGATAQLGCGLYALSNPRFGKSGNVSAIVD
jgi:hypothetical protein